MYFAIVGLLMFILPIASVLIEVTTLASATSATIWVLIGKWFTFWAVGVRLVVAGLNQMFRPQFTAKKIFAFMSDGSHAIIQELGFATFSIGVLGVASLLNAQWVMPAAIIGGVFYGLAGIKHVSCKRRNAAQNLAMVSDVFVSAVLLAVIVMTLT